MRSRATIALQHSGGIQGNEQEIFFLLAKLRTLLQKKSLIGVGCPAHVFNGCIRTAVEILELDFENIIYKT
jgi:hypothetical protein